MTDHIIATLTTEEVAAMLSCSIDTLRRMRRRGDGPRSIVLAGSSVRYLRSDVEAWLAAGGNKIKKKANDA